MKHTARNLFLLVLMGYSLSALPLNTELANLDLSRFSYENALRNQSSQGAVKYAYVLNSSQPSLVDPGEVDFLIRAEGGKKPKWRTAPPLRMDIYDASHNLVKTLDAADFFVFQMPKEGFNPYELRYTLRLDRETLGISGRTFTLKLSGTDPTLEALSPLEVPVQYFDAVKYTAAVTGPASGGKLMRVYYLDKSGHYAVPVSRELPYLSKPFRTTVNELLVSPPDAMGLRTTPSIPNVFSVKYTNGLVSCILGAPVPAELYADPILAAASEAALSDSIAAIESPYKVSRIRYYWSGADPVTGWQQEEHPFYTGSRAWMGIEVSGNRVLLAPLKTDKTTAAELFTLLKSGAVGYLPTIPGRLSLKSSRVEGDVLILNLDAGFRSLMVDAPDQAALLIDSLTHTMTSITGVRAIRLEEDGQPVTVLGGKTLPARLEPAPYVNPESGFITP